MAAITPQQMTDFLRTKSNCVDVIAKRKQDVATVMKERAAKLAASSSHSSMKCPPKLQDYSEDDGYAVALEQAIQESMTSKKHMTEQEELDAAIKASMNPKQHTSEQAVKPIAPPKVVKKVDEWICGEGEVRVWKYKGKNYLRNSNNAVWEYDEKTEDYGKWIGVYVPSVDKFDVAAKDPDVEEAELEAKSAWVEDLSRDLSRCLDIVTEQIPSWHSSYQSNHYRFDELRMQISQSISHIARTEIPLGIRSTFAISEYEASGERGPTMRITGYIYLITNKMLYQLSKFVNDALVQNDNTGKWCMPCLCTNPRVASEFGTMPYGTYYGFVPIATLTDIKISLLNKLRHLFGYVGKASRNHTTYHFEENQQMLQANMDKIHETIMAMCD
jgi:hypothetical protein